MDQVHGSGALGKLEELLERIEVLEAMSDAKSMELTKCQHEIKEAKEEIYQYLESLRRFRLKKLHLEKSISELKMQWLEIAEFDVQSLMGDFPLNTGKSLLECHFQNSSEIRKDFSEKQNQHAEIRKMGRLEMHAYLLKKLHALAEEICITSRFATRANKYLESTREDRDSSNEIKAERIKSRDISAPFDIELSDAEYEIVDKMLEHFEDVGNADPKNLK